MVVVIKFLIKFYFITENIAKVLLPLITIFLFKRILIWYLSRFFLTNKSNKFFLLRNRKLYFIMNHFNFFFDCFLGSFVCFMRMAKSSLAALFFMPRLDYSIFGRFLEKSDMGFISYVTFIHLEVNQSHPIKLAFIELLKRSLDKDKDEYDEHYDNDYKKKHFKKFRNKWSLAVTLHNNPQLTKERKSFIKIRNLMPRVETFEQFLERRFKFKINLGDDAKKKSKSTPCLLDEMKDASTPNIKSSTIDYRKQYRPHQIVSNKVAYLNDNYDPNLDVSFLDDNRLYMDTSQSLTSSPPLSYSKVKRPSNLPINTTENSRNKINFKL
jgi:hypothetical protein